jgi:hypothetical protein
LKYIAAAFCLLFAVAGLTLSSTMPARAATESHVWVQNDSDKWAWITVYQDTNESIMGHKFDEVNHGAWCVAPHTFDKHGLRTGLSRVSAEITQKNCAHPVSITLSAAFPHSGGIQTNTYHVAGQDGRYTFTKK